MAYQSGHNLLVAGKVETTFGVKPTTVTGATRIRLNAGSGLRLGQALINPGEIRSDGNSSASRNGSRSVTGSYLMDISDNTQDDLWAAGLRGTWTSNVLSTTNPPTPYSFTFEEYETDIDATSVYKGCRVGGFTVRLAPDEPATVEFPIVGADMESLTGASAPYYTTPTLSTTDIMTATDAAISVDGTPVLEFTACEFTVDLGAAGIPLVGTKITPDVWTNNMRVTGTITTLRSAATRQAAYLAGTEFALGVLLTDAAAQTLRFDIPRCLFTDYTKGLGVDGPLLVTMPFTAGYKSTATPPSMIYITRSV